MEDYFCYMCSNPGRKGNLIDCIAREKEGQGQGPKRIPRGTLDKGLARERSEATRIFQVNAWIFFFNDTHDIIVFSFRWRREEQASALLVGIFLSCASCGGVLISFTAEREEGDAHPLLERLIAVSCWGSNLSFFPSFFLFFFFSFHKRTKKHHVCLYRSLAADFLLGCLILLVIPGMDVCRRL